MIELTKRIKNLHHSPTLQANDLVTQKRAKNETVYHMGFGESPFPVPERLKLSLAEAAHRKEYLRAEGLSELIDAIREYYRPVLGDEYVDNSDLILAPGSKLNIYAIQMAIEGDLLMPVPSWVSYEPQATMLGTATIKVPTILGDNGFQIAPDVLRKTIKDARAAGHNPRKFILNMPSNPTGLTIPDENLKAMAEICREEEILVISDEIYGFINFNEGYSSMAPFAPEITCVTTGLSKHLSLGGWRLGGCFVPRGVPDMYHVMRCIVSETWSSLATPIQQTSIDCYKRHPDIEDHIQACTDIHKLMNHTIAREFQSLGIKAPLPQGAFYNYPNFEAFRASFAAKGITGSQELHEVLLNDYSVATLPGHAFGEAPEVLTLRISGCDYNGAKALEAYQGGETLDENFIQKHAPNVRAALGQFEKFIGDYGAAEKTEDKTHAR